MASCRLVHSIWVCRRFWDKLYHALWYHWPHSLLIYSSQQGLWKYRKVISETVNICPWSYWKVNYWSDRETKPMMKICGFLSKTPFICHPVAFSRQAGRQELLSEVPAGWKAEEGKTLRDSTLESCWPGSSCPHQGGRPCSAYLRQEIRKGSQGLAPGKRPGQAPCWPHHRTILISSPRPRSPGLGP